MEGRDSSCLLHLLACCLLFQFAHGGYLVTLPKEISVGIPTQLCVFVNDTSAPAGSLTIKLLTESRKTFSASSSGPSSSSHEPSPPPFTKYVSVPAGKTEYCEDIVVPEFGASRGYLNMTGEVSGKAVDHSVQITVQKKIRERTFIQTDKYTYQAGENVKIRVLTIQGPKLNISTTNYPEVYIESPSRTRISQWLDVDNTAGLVHLDMDLVDEPEEGFYTIYVKTLAENLVRQDFKVEPFVLPRFDVEIKNPAYIVATDHGFNFSVCARYTFGQPVKGSLTMNINNSQRQPCLVNITRTVNVTGCHEFDFTTAEMRVGDCEVYSLPIRAIFEEDGTGVSRDIFETFSITRNPINFIEIYADEYMKPNLPFSIKLKAQYPDSTPASGVPVEVCAAEACNKQTTAADGIFTAVLPTYSTNRIYMKSLNCRADLNAATYSKNLDHFHSPTNSSLLIFAPENELKCSPNGPSEYNLQVMFSANNQTTAVITVQVVSRGQMQHWSTKEYELIESELPILEEHLVEPLPTLPEGFVRGVVNIPITLPITTSPKAKVLVWYSREDGEVVSDTREVSVEKCLSNYANLTWSVEQAQPGDEATVSLASKPSSICSLGVVDRSTILLSEASGKLDLDSLFNFANQFNINRYGRSQINDQEYCSAKEESELAGSLTDTTPVFRDYDYQTSFADTIKMFDIAGLYVFSDHITETRPCEKSERIFFAFAGGFGAGGGGDVQNSFAPIRPFARPPSGSSEADKASGGFESKEVDVPRTEFPETWLWDIVTVPSTGVLTQKVTLPDTVTEWVGNAVCALPGEGIGLSQEANIRTFLPFFIDLTLPPSLKRGEILPVKISIFNYLPQNLPVTVRLEESLEYEILEDPAITGPKGQRTICLSSQDKDVQTIRINALELGDVNLTVTAYVDYEGSQNCNTADQTVNRRDTIIKPIKVEPEGYPREKSWSKYICSEDFTTGDDAFEAWDVSLPPKIVEGSERGWVTAMGDLLGLTLEHLGSLIRMPYGCGEQNMLNFVPNIFIRKYLETTKQLTKTIEDKLQRFMTTGYRRELLYRHNNGAFSAFGSADDFGSTWLTAFVLKSFAQAQPYILIDETSLNETRTWLMEQQDTESGCFLSIGKVFHKGMQGGVSGGNNSIPLTTYVLISLLEAGENPASKTVVLAKKCIDSEVTTDPYTKALIAYASVLAKHDDAQKAIDELLGLAVVATNETYWNLPETPSKSKATELETAAYAILALVEHDFELYEKQTRKIVKWIMKQRNGRGGFYSTQDTVMALQALARYESFLFQGPLDIKASATATNFSYTFTVNESNKLLQQLEILPTFPTQVDLTMEGQGCAVLQAVLRYNIPDPEPSDAFDITVNTRTTIDNLCKTKLITVCSSYRLPDEKSNMAVIEVNLVSGYIPEKEDLKKLVRENRDTIKRYEVDGSKVSFYIEELTAKSTCVNFNIIRDVDVENVKPGTAVVYDYYQPEFSVSESYTLPPPEECRR